MIAFGHSSTGVIVGAGFIYATSSTPTASLLLLCVIAGVLSHYICDFIPHGHYHFGKGNFSAKSWLIFSLDFFAIIALFLGLIYHQFGFGPELLFISAGIIGAQLPDLWEAAIDLEVIPKTKFSKLHRYWHYKILHWHGQESLRKTGEALPLGLLDIWQVAVFGIALWVIARLPKL